MTKIRPALPADADQIVPLVKDFVTSFSIDEDILRNSLHELLSSPEALLLVACDGAEIIGYVLAFDHSTLFANGRVTWVEEIMVRPDWRRTGAGRSLMLHCEQWAQSRGSRMGPARTLDDFSELARPH